MRRYDRKRVTKGTNRLSEFAIVDRMIRQPRCFLAVRPTLDDDDDVTTRPRLSFTVQWAYSGTFNESVVIVAQLQCMAEKMRTTA